MVKSGEEDNVAWRIKKKCCSNAHICKLSNSQPLAAVIAGLTAVECYFMFGCSKMHSMNKCHNVHVIGVDLVSAGYRRPPKTYINQFDRCLLTNCITNWDSLSRHVLYLLRNEANKNC